jgi:hypothetical protein
MTITPIEVSVVAGAFFLFSFLPGVFGWMASARQRRAQAMALRQAAPEPAVTEPLEAVAEIPIAAELSTTVGEFPMYVAPPPPVAQPPTEAAVESVPAAEPAVPEPVVAPVVDQGGYTFRLDDLRRARILETPPREVLDDPAGQQQWEDGLRLSEKHAGLIGATALSASFEPQSRCFGGVRERGETRDLRFFLFSELWPTAIDQAAAEAVFELGDAGLIKAYVVRR